MFELGAVGLAMFLLVALVLLLLLVCGFMCHRRHFLQHWMPAVIGGLFLIGIVPVANSIYWVRQQEFEGCVQDRDKSYELLASTARAYTNLFKVHTELAHLSQQMVSLQTRKLRPEHRRLSLEALLRLRSELVKERIRLESQIAADSALMSRYLPENLTVYNTLALKYDKQAKPGSTLDPTRDNKLVQAVTELVGSMAKEARKSECH